MHRATPANSSFRSYSSGGARTCIDQADDSKLMQEMGGNFMKGETRSAVESPQNYGFSSVVMDADKDGDGKMTGSAEGFIQFVGGNRSFPVCGVMDDRRHRLKGLEKGDVAMFRTKSDAQQFHMTGDGGFWSAPQGKTVRMQLVSGPANPNPPQSGGGTTPQQRDASGGGGSAPGASSSKPTGQAAVYKDGQSGVHYVDITTEQSRLSGKRATLLLDDRKGYVDCTGDDKQVWLGYPKGEGKFAHVLTEDGPSDNVWGRLAPGGGGELLQAPEAAAAPKKCFYAATADVEALALRVEMLERRIEQLERWPIAFIRWLIPARA